MLASGLLIFLFVLLLISFLILILLLLFLWSIRGRSHTRPSKFDESLALGRPGLPHANLAVRAGAGAQQLALFQTAEERRLGK